MSVSIEASWKNLLKAEFESKYFADLKNFLVQERSKFIIYPTGSKIFNAFDTTPFDKVKVVVIGQDPYHGFGQANGLCFSVSDGIKQPPSLQNVFKELASDLKYPIPLSGNLEPWAKQGVLLLNTTLTVREGQAGSHQNQGWERFTDAVIKEISEHKTGVVFLLWGKFAQSKIPLIDTHKHFILEAAHPSPFSAYNGFFGCKHFSRTNEILKHNQLQEINWKIE
jgi:uracil-DNA glycosylase